MDDLLEAIRENDVTGVRRLLAAGADVNGRGAEGDMPLATALWLKRKRLFRLLLAAGADVNAADDGGDTPLIDAADSDDPEYMRLLLEAGANVNARNHVGSTALHEATTWGTAPAVRQLVAAGADVNHVRSDGETALSLAVLWGRASVVRRLLEAGARPDIEGAADPLMAACMLGHTGIIRRLLAAGADAGRVADFGRTALLNALSCNDELTEEKRLRNVRLLLAAGADPNAAFLFTRGDLMAGAYPPGTSALMVAAKAGYSRIVRALLAAGADPGASTERGETPMSLAVAGGYGRIVAQLEAAGVGRPSDDRGLASAVLLRAAKDGDAATVRRCLADGADPDVVDPDPSEAGRTALFQAAAGGHAAVVRLLLEAGACPTAGEQSVGFFGEGKTALHAAAESGCEGAVAALLEAGVDPDTPDRAGGTALRYAASGGHTGVVRLLVGAGSRTDGVRALLAAVTEDRLETALALISAGFRPDATVLAAACRRGQTRVIRGALRAGISVNVLTPDFECVEDAEAKPDPETLTRPLCAAAKFQAEFTVRDGKTAVVNVASNRPWLARAEEMQRATFRLLLDAGADVNAADGRGRTALLLLATLDTIVSVRTEPDRGARHIHGEMDPRPAMQLLLEAGADLNVRDRAGNTPLTALIRAARMTDTVVPIVRFLVDHGAAVTAANAEGSGPLHLVTELPGVQCLPLTNLLLAAGADVNAPDLGGHTPLLRAIRHGQGEAVLRALLAAGADVTVADLEGSTALTLALEADCPKPVLDLLRRQGGTDPKKKARGLLEAARAGDCRRISELLATGADVNEPFRGVGPLAAAVGEKRVEAARALLAAGASVELRGPGARGASPLVLAAQHGSEDLIRLLLGARAEPNARDAGGNSALLYAAWAGCRGGVAALLAAGARSDKTTERFLEVLRFAERAEAPGFRDAVAALAALTGVPAKPLETDRLKGVAYFHILATDVVDSLLESGAETYRLSAELRASREKVESLLGPAREICRERGFTVVDLGCAGICVDGRLIGLFPTRDPLTILAAVGTRDNEGEQRTPVLIERFRELAKDHPYVLNECSFDTVDITFTQPIADPGGLAERLYDLCPDMVDQGTGSVDALAESLAETRRAHFWWD